MGVLLFLAAIYFFRFVLKFMPSTEIEGFSEEAAVEVIDEAILFLLQEHEENHFTPFSLEDIYKKIGLVCDERFKVKEEGWKDWHRCLWTQFSNRSKNTLLLYPTFGKLTTLFGVEDWYDRWALQEAIDRNRILDIVIESIINENTDYQKTSWEYSKYC